MVDQNGRAGARPYKVVYIGILQLACAALITLIVFYALNPAWWGDPLGRAREVLASPERRVRQHVTQPRFQPQT
jgi:hypothetical protein